MIIPNTITVTVAISEKSSSIFKLIKANNSKNTADRVIVLQFFKKTHYNCQFYLAFFDNGIWRNEDEF